MISFNIYYHKANKPFKFNNTVTISCTIGHHTVYHIYIIHNIYKAWYQLLWKWSFTTFEVSNTVRVVDDGSVRQLNNVSIRSREQTATRYVDSPILITILRTIKI